jgi:hypothetical protein
LFQSILFIKTTLSKSPPAMQVWVGLDVVIFAVIDSYFEVCRKMNQLRLGSVSLSHFVRTVAAPPARRLLINNILFHLGKEGEKTLRSITWARNNLEIYHLNNGRW